MDIQPKPQKAPPGGFILPQPPKPGVTIIYAIEGKTNTGWSPIGLKRYGDYKEAIWAMDIKRPYMNLYGCEDLRVVEIEETRRPIR